MQKSNHAAESIEIAVPISEKYTLTIKEAALYFNIGVKKKCAGLQKKIWEDMQFTVETAIS